jgi:hypothetical protein
VRSIRREIGIWIRNVITYDAYLITDPCPGHIALNVAITELVRYISPS